MSWQTRQNFLGPESDKVLRDSRAGIIGVGGGGSHLAQQLAHVGVGKFVFCDPDVYEDKNHNRTVGGMAIDIERETPKVQIAERLVRGINPDADVHAIKNVWQSDLQALRDCDVLFGCVDSFSERDQLEKFCRRFLIPYIDIGMDVHEAGPDFVIQGQIILSLPGSLCMRCFNFLRPELLEQEARDYGKAGGNPQVIWPNGVLASTAVGLFMQLLLLWHQQVRTGSLIFDYDGNRHTVQLSSRLAALQGMVCPHFGQIADLGDPLWRPERNNLNSNSIRKSPPPNL